MTCSATLMFQWHLRLSGAMPSLLLRLWIKTFRCTKQMIRTLDTRSQQTRLAASQRGDRVLLLRERQVCLTRRPTTPPWVAATVCLKTPGFKRRAEATVPKCRQHSSGFIDLRLDMYTTRSMMLAQRCSMQHTVSYLSRLRQLYLDPTQFLTNNSAS